MVNKIYFKSDIAEEFIKLINECDWSLSEEEKEVFGFLGNIDNGNRKIKKTGTSLEEFWGSLMIYLKYQKLDLESLRRENQFLRKLLEEDGE